MKRSIFGRRETAASSSAANNPIVLPGLQPDTDGVSRVLSKSLFDGPAGQMLTSLGFSPDNPFNIIPAPDAQDARRNALAEASRDQFIARINAQLPMGIVVKPWPLIPSSIWAGEYAGFLNRVVGLVPASPDNTMLLGGDLVSALSLNLPELPSKVPAEIEHAANERLAVLQGNFQEDAKKLAANGLMPNPDEVRGLRRKYLAEIIATAKDLGISAFGQQNWDRHQALFGQALSPNKN
ncbi:MAG TPA: hypothetical protein VGK90_14410 [Rhizomicrobium sp.]|jgi:hypothetical protein